MVHTDDLPNTPAKVLTSSRARNVSRATPRVAPKIEYRDPDTPSPSPSSGSDDGSVYQEANKSTPEVDDLKPVISEDEPDSPPSPSKRRKTSSGPNRRASGSGSPKKVTPKKQGASGGGKGPSMDSRGGLEALPAPVSEGHAQLGRSRSRHRTRRQGEYSSGLSGGVATARWLTRQSCSNRMAILNKRIPTAIKGISGQ